MSTPKFSQRYAKLIHFCKLNILAIAIGSGVSTYFLFHYVDFLAPIKYPIKHTMDEVVPFLIFSLLFLAFTKVELRRMRPRRWHFILLAIQILVPAAIAAVIVNYAVVEWRVELEGAIACFITPTAAAAAVITGKLGGDESSLTTYTILSNMGAAIGIPVIFPFVSTLMNTNGFAWESFYELFSLIMAKVFPMIVLPLILAQGIRYLVKPVHNFIVVKLKGLSFYLWAFTLSTISATAVSNVMNSPESNATLINLALVGLVTTALQFALGKAIGHLEGQRISAGQGLGQKNMVFGIWVTAAYLSPAASIAPGCYILWQNVVNSWQLWYRERQKVKYFDSMD